MHHWQDIDAGLTETRRAQGFVDVRVEEHGADRRRVLAVLAAAPPT